MIKYDNCKSCKIDRATVNQERTAREFIKAIKTISQHPERLENLEAYLSAHFSEWIQKYAKTPEDITFELLSFAELEV